MWLTTDGERFLRGAQGDMVRGAIGMMLDQLVAEGRETEEGTWNEVDAEGDHSFSIDWFDRWDWRQRIWLLEQVTTGLLTASPAPQPNAMLEATVDAIFRETYDLTVFEIAETDAGTETFSWRESVLEAVLSQGIKTRIRMSSADPASWLELITRFADALFGPRSYLKAEAFRDGDIRQTVEFLQQRGLPTDYLEAIPPLRSVDQTQLSVDRIQSLVFS